MGIHGACSRERSRCQILRTAFALIASLVTIVIAADSALAQVTFQDNSFSDPDWTATVFFISGNGGTGSAAQQASGGNPGAYRRVTHTMGTRPAQLGMVHERTGATYDPQTEGAVGAIDFSFDANTFFDSGYGGQSATLAIRQDGVIYGGPFFANGDNVWRSAEYSGLVATDFTEWDGVSHPVFSSTGGVLQFGLITSNSNPEDGIIGPSTTIVGYDNWSVVISAATAAVELRPASTQIAHTAVPNPFVRDTAIWFALERAAQVCVRVFDAGGRTVRQFDLPGLSPGTHEVSWDGRDSAGRPAPTGAYFYRIQADARAATGRMRLVR